MTKNAPSPGRIFGAFADLGHSLLVIGMFAVQRLDGRSAGRVRPVRVGTGLICTAVRCRCSRWKVVAALVIAGN